MKIPHSLFFVINPTMKLLLASPFHWLMSKSVLVIYFTGRKSGRAFSTPVRYQKVGDKLRCFSSEQGNWWRNFRGGASVSLRLKRQLVPATAVLLELSVEEKLAVLRAYLQEFPADAPYHEVALDRHKQPIEGDLQHAATNSAIVEITLTTT